MTEQMDLKAYMLKVGLAGQQAAQALQLADTEQKNLALRTIASHIDKNRQIILAANTKDLSAADAKGISIPMRDRLMLNPDRIQAIIANLHNIEAQPDPIGHVDQQWQHPNGLHFSQVRVPIGVIGMIYESRPNVTVDAAAICLKSGNAVILRGGSESYHSNQSLYGAIQTALVDSGLPETAIQLISTTHRDAVGFLMQGLNNTVDLLIPRGGKGLVKRIQTDARIPVLSHLEGICHSYVHKGADVDKACALIINAKMRRPAVCGATETVLIDKAIAPDALPVLAHALSESGCALRGTHEACALVNIITPASEVDFHTEHLGPILNIKVVANINAAIKHINSYGSGHTDCIITEQTDAAEQFLQAIDSAIVMHNSSTQFADGGEFGFGAEIGIATGRLHARGPIGVAHLTSYKYKVRGQGQVRP